MWPLDVADFQKDLVVFAHAFVFWTDWISLFAGPKSDGLPRLDSGKKSVVLGYDRG